MIETKLFEVRDIGTCMPVMATLVKADGPIGRAESWLIRRAGWGVGQRGLYLRVLDPHNRKWATAQVGSPTLFSSAGLDDSLRTLPAAFGYIAERWDELTDGQVVDVRVILGEATEPARSDRFYGKDQ